MAANHNQSPDLHDPEVGQGHRYQQALNPIRIGQPSRLQIQLSAKDDITDAVKYASDISTWLSWSFGAAHSLLRSILQDVDPYVGILPLLVKYGVSTRAAAYASLLGISDRTAAQDFSRQFELINLPPTLQRVSEWLDSMGGDDIVKMLEARDHGLRTELVKRQVFRGRSGADPYQFTRLMAKEDIPAGAILTARQEDDRLVLLNDENIVGEFISKRGFISYHQDSLPLLVAVPISDIPRGRIGNVAVVEPAKI